MASGRKSRNDGPAEHGATREPVGTPGLRFHAFAATCVVVLGLAAYANSFGVPFVFDDQNNIVSNQHVRWNSLDWQQWLGAARESRNSSRPVAYISFGLNHYFGKYDVRGYHAVNVTIHLLCSVLVYLLALATLQLGGPPGSPRSRSSGTHWVALAAALIFVSHPIQTQAVTYIVQRMASLCALFYLAALLLYIQGRTAERPARRWAFWVAGLVCWLLALGTKQTAATLPIAILLYEWLFFQDSSRDWLTRSLVFGLPAILLLGGVVFLYLGTSPLEGLLGGDAVRGLTPSERVMTQFRVLVFYLGLVLWPMPSRFSLTHDIPASHSLFDPATTFLSLLILAGLLLVAVLGARRFRVVSFCIVWFFVQLAIESSVIPLEMAYEHRMYLPMAGLSLLLAWIAFSVLQDTRLAIATVAGLSLLLAFATHERNRVWQDERSLWEDVVAKYPRDARAYGNSGDAHERAGEHYLAIEAFDHAIRLLPNYLKAYVNRGRAYASIGQHARALEDFNHAIGIRREDVQLSADYDYAYRERGLIFLQAGEYRQATDDFTRAIQAGMDDSSLYNLRGVAQLGSGEFRGAVRDLRRAIELDPDSMDAHNNLGWIRATCRDPAFIDGDEALAHAKRASELSNWQNPSSLDTLAAAYAQRGEFDHAVDWQRKAVELTPSGQQDARRQRLDLYVSGRAFREEQAPSVTIE